MTVVFWWQLCGQQTSFCSDTQEHCTKTQGHCSGWRSFTYNAPTRKHGRHLSYMEITSSGQRSTRKSKTISPFTCLFLSDLWFTYLSVGWNLPSHILHKAVQRGKEYLCIYGWCRWETSQQDVMGECHIIYWLVYACWVCILIWPQTISSQMSPLSYIAIMISLNILFGTSKTTEKNPDTWVTVHKPEKWYFTATNKSTNHLEHNYFLSIYFKHGELCSEVNWRRPFVHSQLNSDPCCILVIL